MPQRPPRQNRSRWTVPLAVAPGIALVAACMATAVARAETAHLRDDGRWKAVDARRPGEVPGFRPVRQVDLSRYGGLAAKRFEATGFFRTERVGGRWWLVDPDGCRFLSVGLCSVNLSMFDGPGKYGSKDAWAKATAALVRKHGFNTLGRWSSAETFRSLSPPMVYCTSPSFMSSYKNRRPEANGARGYPPWRAWKSLTSGWAEP